MAFKPRILITVATKDCRSDITIVKGQLMRDGSPSPGPSDEQIAIINRAIVELLNAPGKEPR